MTTLTFTKKRRWNADREVSPLKDGGAEILVLMQKAGGFYQHTTRKSERRGEPTGWML